MSKKVLMKGTDAIAEAAIRAGCRCYFGYPITPQNEIPEYMSRRMDEVGGVFLQGESEIASINMVLGAAATDPQRKAMLAKVEAADFEQIVKDPKMMEFVRSVGKGLFGDNCAACHGRGGQGVIGLYPNLTDDDWLWGGKMEKIHETLVQGRKAPVQKLVDKVSAIFVPVIIDSRIQS